MSDAAPRRMGESTMPTARQLHVVIEELGRTLAVLSGQLTHSVEEASRECVALGASFHELADANSRIAAASRTDLGLSSIPAHCAQINHSLGCAVVALQYQDRLAQRIGHICSSLNGLQALLHDGHERSYDEWLELLRRIEQTQQAEQARLVGPHCATNSSAELF